MAAYQRIFCFACWQTDEKNSYRRYHRCPMNIISMWTVSPGSRAFHLCHPERSRAIREANCSAQSKDSVTTCAILGAKESWGPSTAQSNSLRELPCSAQDDKG